MTTQESAPPFAPFVLFVAAYGLVQKAGPLPFVPFGDGGRGQTAQTAGPTPFAQTLTQRQTAQMAQTARATCKWAASAGNRAPQLPGGRHG